MENWVIGQDQKVYEKLRQLAAGRLTDRFTVAMTAYEDARSDGLCHDGAWECALAALGMTKSEMNTNSEISKK